MHRSRRRALVVPAAAAGQHVRPARSAVTCGWSSRRAAGWLHPSSRNSSGQAARPAVRHVRADGGHRPAVLPAPGEAPDQARLDRQGHPRRAAAGARRGRRPVPPGVRGEIYAPRRSISPGYLDDPEASAEKFTDLGPAHRATWPSWTTRATSTSWTAGTTSSSRGVTASPARRWRRAALRMDRVSAAAIGVPDDEAGEAVVLFVQPRPDAEVTRRRSRPVAGCTCRSTWSPAWCCRGAAALQREREDRQEPASRDAALPAAPRGATRGGGR